LQYVLQQKTGNVLITGLTNMRTVLLVTKVVITMTPGVLPTEFEVLGLCSWLVCFCLIYF